MRKLLVSLIVLALLVPVLSAQDATPEATPEMQPWTCPSGYEGQTLSIYNWSTYIAEDTVPNFEEACGVSVSYDIYDSNETMLARIRQGNPGYDIVVPTSDTVATMIRENLLEPLNYDLIPNKVNVTPHLLDGAYDPGNVYTLPYQWGTLGIGYNTEVFPDGITSWDQVWNHDGPVAWIEDRRAMLGIALSLLGYDPNTDNGDEINAAKDFLIAHGGNVVAIAGDDGQEMLARGDVDIAIEYSGDIFAIADECGCDTYAYSIPVEGTNLWTDNIGIPVDAPNPDLANVFINYILDPQVGADISNYTAYASPNQAAIDAGLIDPEYLSDPGIYPSPETLDRLFVIHDTPPDAEQLYNDAWDAVVIAVGG